MEGLSAAHDSAACSVVSASPTTSKSVCVARSDTSERRSSGSLSATTMRMRFGAGRFVTRETILLMGLRAAARLTLFAATRFLDERTAGFRAVAFDDFLTVRATRDPLGD